MRPTGFKIRRPSVPVPAPIPLETPFASALPSRVSSTTTLPAAFQQSQQFSLSPGKRGAGVGVLAVKSAQGVHKSGTLPRLRASTRLRQLFSRPSSSSAVPTPHASPDTSSSVAFITPSEFDRMFNAPAVQHASLPGLMRQTRVQLTRIMGTRSKAIPGSPVPSPRPSLATIDSPRHSLLPEDTCMSVADVTGNLSDMSLSKLPPKINVHDSNPDVITRGQEAFDKYQRDLIRAVLDNTHYLHSHFKLLYAYTINNHITPHMLLSLLPYFYLNHDDLCRPLYCMHRSGTNFVCLFKTTSNGQPVLVKFLHRSAIPPAQWTKDDMGYKIPMEVAVFRSNRHVGLPSYLCDFFDDSLIYIVMELNGIEKSKEERGFLGKKHHDIDWQKLFQ